MKLLLAVTAFVLCAQLAVSIPEDVQQVVVDYMNRHRESFAVSLPAANMNAIVYNASLEKRTTTCAVAEHAAKNDRGIFFESLALDKGIDSGGDIDPRTAEQIMDPNTKGSEVVHVRQLLQPSFDGMGCVMLRRPCLLRSDRPVDPKHGENFAVKVTAICYFGGPEIRKPLEGLKRGEPGSHCPNGKSEISDYMCKA
ncbi:hypothetical protein GCK72_012145 [Caenorhabditis remanei]|uniref:SCP domain-containing protein n=1 Tax=Caenorhabditis remanei TaxID=31234 RepID=A0A6A5GME0_CAERE|nr:hypothetical protein GCK72_012145 [Caenorhabditis remanei]KAF1755695.1 hypothetical protein GCK72_012145 [Caenorhabditis remanei]